MGVFLNRGTSEFERAVNSKIYVDKTDMVQFFNDRVNTEQNFVCVSRPRRFGKTMAANMLAAYFEKGSDARFLFENRKLGQLEGWDRNLNKFNVLRIDVAYALALKLDSKAALTYIEETIVSDIVEAFPAVEITLEMEPAVALDKVNAATGEQFIIIIDEWDAFFRDEKLDFETQKNYIMLLRTLFKSISSKKFTALAYITGILPIKRYESESALNNFDEFTMIRPFALLDYVGFTEDEVRKLCELYYMDYNELCSWYDGYTFEKKEIVNGKRKTIPVHIFGPNSVIKAILNVECCNYWSKTTAYDSLAGYITMNFDGLKDDIIEMIGGGRTAIDPEGFQNDMTSFKTKDDVMTVLIHLGYLGYDSKTNEVYIPNKEVMQCYKNTLKATDWTSVTEALDNSIKLLDNLLKGNAEAVASGIEKCHRDNTSILKYNDENSLASVIGLSFYAARDKYQLIREMPAGEGFADIVFLPRPGVTEPAIIMELKWKDSPDSALRQIKDKKYPEALKDYSGNILLVGISYEKDGSDSKKHTCVIERI